MALINLHIDCVTVMFSQLWKELFNNFVGSIHSKTVILIVFLLQICCLKMCMSRMIPYESNYK